MIGVKVTRLKEAIVQFALNNSGKKKVRKATIRGLARMTPYEFQTALPYLKYNDPIGKFIEEEHFYLIIDCDGIRRTILGDKEH